MLYGRAENGELIEATPGAVAFCPTCSSPTPLRAKCGKARKQVWHWAHVAKDCDPWHEPEGAWHLGWKRLAPKGCTEVTMAPHRADIRLPDGLVIELQASSIDGVEIREREQFYGRMIWLLDGRKWYAGFRFGFALGRERRCDSCEKVMFRGHEYTRGGCKVCGGTREVIDRTLGDRYWWTHRKRSFDDARCPIYVDTGENVVRIEGLLEKAGNARVISYAAFCQEYGLGQMGG